MLIVKEKGGISREIDENRLADYTAKGYKAAKAEPEPEADKVKQVENKGSGKK